VNTATPFIPPAKFQGPLVTVLTRIFCSSIKTWEVSVLLGELKKIDASQGRDGIENTGWVR